MRMIDEPINSLAFPPEQKSRFIKSTPWKIELLKQFQEKVEKLCHHNAGFN